MPRTIQHLAEYGLAGTLLGIVDVLPLPIAVSAARGLGRLWYRVDARRRRVAVDNVVRAGIAPSAAQAALIARASFEHFAVLLAESLKSRRAFNRPDWRDRIEWGIPPELEAILEEPGRGVLLASGHLGNWETAAQLLSRTKPVVGVTRRMNNPYVERLIRKRKPTGAFTLTPKRSADSGRFLRALKEGKILALLIDQHAPRGRIQVNFFGRPCTSYTAIALLHLVTQAPLCFGYCVRTGLMRFRFKATGPLSHPRTGDKERDVREILESLNRELEEAVRAYPEQYLWAHRRWRGERPAPGPS